MKSLWRVAGDGTEGESDAAIEEGPDHQTGAVPGVGGVGGGGGGCLPSVAVPGVGGLLKNGQLSYCDVIIIVTIAVT